jgi:hypothetical protein
MRTVFAVENSAIPLSKFAAPGQTFRMASASGASLAAS